ncbi:MAG: hypothetical protein DI606_17815 [Sphingobium sp.]|uniref:S9 family peptidase n=1 Tax=Sphingobium sp. TaxID=1912891 RepID=UPI000DB522D5|nr:prolyl oligopeptidase family serine peptidase [Sphingobium sp.]PZU06651.1 MAG: hypothetical protein DI606_17815 [Sphingobium sp.]
MSRVVIAMLLILAPSIVSSRPMSVDDVLGMERLDRAQLSPDGMLLAAVVLRPARDEEIYGRAAYEIDPSRADIWLIDRSTGVRRNLTEGHAEAAGSWCATWSPDGQRLAFLSTRPEGTEPKGGNNVRLYMWDRTTDRVHRLSDQAIVTQTRYGSGVNRLDFAGPGSNSPNVCTIGDENAPFVWLDGSRLLAAMLPSGSISSLLEATERFYRHVSMTRDKVREGQEAVVSASASGAERTTVGSDQEAILTIVNVETGTSTDLAHVPAYPFKGSLAVRVSPRGDRAAVMATTGVLAPAKDASFPRNDGEWLVQKKLGLVDLHRPKAIEWMKLPDEAALPLLLVGWAGDAGDTFTFAARPKLESQAVQYFAANTVTGVIRPETDRKKDIMSSRPAGLPEKAQLIGRDAKGIVWSEQTAQGLFVRASARNGKAVTLLELNRHLAAVETGRTFEFDYLSGHGEPLKAAVLLPPGYKGGRVPVITWGYAVATVPSWSDYSLDLYMPGIYNLHLYAAQGFAILLPSIPLKRDGKQDPLTELALDVDPAVDRLVELGIADRTRVGFMGQSFGGYTALGLATQSHRFNAIVAIAPISDLRAYYGAFDPTARGYDLDEQDKSDNVVIAELTSPAAQGPPYAKGEFYQRNSPLSFVDQVNAPVLLIHGDLDIRGTTYQSEAFYTGLWRQGKTARILRYGGENHSLAGSPATVRSVVSEICEWFHKYLSPGSAR